MGKRVQIPLTLYEAMVDYIENHRDPECREQYEFIRIGIQAKRDAEIRHNLYTAYKSTTDPEEREVLRQSYLDKAGMPSHGRWGQTTEAAYQKGDFLV